MKSRDIALEDPRVIALARERQQLAHEGMLHPTWDELTDAERAGSLPDARSYLVAAIRAGLVAPLAPETGASARLRRLGELSRTEWPLVRARLRCACTDADPARCTGSPEPSGTPRCGPAPGNRQCSCHHVRTADEYAAIRAAATAEHP